MFQCRLAVELMTSVTLSADDNVAALSVLLVAAADENLIRATLPESAAISYSNQVVVE